jgi:hypothetical protein
MRQADLARRTGLSQPEISDLERGHGSGTSLLIWSRAAEGAGSQLAAFLEHGSGADLPRDHQHLRRQQLVVQASRSGGWIARPELRLDAYARFSRSVDVALLRPSLGEAAVVEIWDFFDDVGTAMRSLDGKIATLERLHSTARDIRAAEVVRVRGLWVVRGTKRNRPW